MKVLGKLTWGIGNEDELKSLFRGTQCYWDTVSWSSKKGSLNVGDRVVKLLVPEVRVTEEGARVTLRFAVWNLVAQLIHGISNDLHLFPPPQPSLQGSFLFP